MFLPDAFERDVARGIPVVINTRCSGNAPRPFVFNNQFFLDRSIHIIVFFPTHAVPWVEV